MKFRLRSKVSDFDGVARCSAVTFTVNGNVYVAAGGMTFFIMAGKSYISRMCRRYRETILFRTGVPRGRQACM